MHEAISINSLYNKDIINGSFYPVAKAYYFKEWDGFSMHFHAHNAVEIMYVISGSCLVETENASLTMKKGELILLDADIRHRLQVEKGSPCRMLNIEFGFTPHDTFLPSFGDIVRNSDTMKQLLRSGKPYIFLRDSDEIYVTMKSLILELDRDDTMGNHLVQLLFAQLLIRLSRLYREEASGNSGLSVLHVKKAVQFMHHNYDNDIQIKDIAASANVHPVYLQRIFKSNKGCTVSEYLLRLRMEKAKSLLANTDIQISDIPGYIGINSRQYFAFIFKKYTGSTPSDYRAAAEKQMYKY